MSIFKRNKRKEKRGIVPVPPERTYPHPSYWETYDGGDAVDSPPVPYDSSSTTYDTPTHSTPSQSYDTGSSSGSGYTSSDSGYSSSGGDSGSGPW